MSLSGEPDPFHENDSRSDETQPRCNRCGYLLIHLVSDRCPECGKPFDLRDTRTFRYRIPINWFRYWLPPFVMLSVIWLAYAMVLLERNSVGWALVLGTPASIGILAGYGLNVGTRRIVLFGGMLITGVGTCLIIANAVGPFCGVILSVLFILPFMCGAAFGTILRYSLKDTRWYSQRRHLPVLLALILPVATEWFERSLGLARPIVAQSTQMSLRATLAEAWQAHARDSASVEKHPLHSIRLTRPLEQVGSRKSGEESTIRFSKGSLRVRVTERDPMKRFAFDYVGQSHVEDRAIRLIATTFDYSRTFVDLETSLVITTHYEALMTPRWYWAPFEKWSGRVTHELIGRQMQRDIDANRSVSNGLTTEISSNR